MPKIDKNRRNFKRRRATYFKGFNMRCGCLRVPLFKQITAQVTRLGFNISRMPMHVIRSMINSRISKIKMLNRA